MLEHCSAWLVVNTQIKACSRESHSPSQESKIYGQKAFQVTHLYVTVISGHAALLNTTHTVGVHCGASRSADCGYNPG